MTKAVGPKHKPDLWKVRAKSQVFSTAGLSGPPLFLHFFSFFHDPPFLSSPRSPSSCLSLSHRSMLSLCQEGFFFLPFSRKQELKVLNCQDRGRKTLSCTQSRVGG